MDKTRKLRRYTRKDYSQVVDFPVEIVGRDGVVRRYSFEESVRLYQRRIASAPNRYDDGELAKAEAEHCERRIAQLRRSYFEHYGADGLRVFEQLGPPGLAGEVAAFLRRGLSVDSDLTRYQVELAGTLERCHVYGLRPPEGGAALVLYVYTFEEPGPCPARDAFFQQVKVLQALQRGLEGVESLLAFHHTADSGFVLTATGEVAADLAPDGAVEPTGAPWGGDEPSSNAPYREALLRLRQGDPEAALQGFVQAYELDHFRRSAYLGAAVVADQLGRFDEAAMAAEMGSRYFPDDPSLAWHLAVARLRRGETGQARAALARAQACEAHPHAITFLRALIALREGRMRSGRRLLQVAGGLDAGPDEALAVGRRRVRGALGLLSVARLGAQLGVVAGAWLVLRGAPAGWAVMAGCGAAWLALPWGWRAWLHRTLALPGRRGLGLASAATLATSTQRADRSQ